ncbi:hypothetical protein RSOLAG1IB_11927 [Rhizoctonia solani AG-1 IB]|uniref:Uncharacterized protein n=1 Tax=Thanatephorus cucumeris (strain AG1-IB / isolate 7/3/14) TaxID=1108050 RepID=A0A0B7FFQ5_THACB|nr:hypothetical protein RSOLAG1IB_11927 [Rhizoctonia solani AG-1 IB]
MDKSNRPSKGIRALAGGMEDELFGQGGYQWFLEENALKFSNNALRSRINRPIGLSKSRTSASTSPAEVIDRLEETEQARPKSEVTSNKSKRKRMKSRSRRSGSTPLSTPVTSPPALSSTSKDSDNEVVDISDDGEVDDKMEIEDEIDEIESIGSERSNLLPSDPKPSLPRPDSPPSAQKSLAFPLARVHPHTASFSQGRSKNRRPSNVVNRMFVDMSDSPKIPKVSPRKSDSQAEVEGKGKCRDV